MPRTLVVTSQKVASVMRVIVGMTQPVFGSVIRPVTRGRCDY
jgi:hypothetical protein